MSTDFTVLQANKSDVNKLVELENKSWVPELQASRETILKRLELGHIMLCVPNSEGNKFIGKICFAYSNFSPRDFNSFPKKFIHFANPIFTFFRNAAFIYDLDIDPEYRGGGKLASFLIKEAIRKAKKIGCKYVVGDGRCPSYNGSRREKIKKSLDFRKEIDTYLKEVKFPAQNDFLLDPILAFYHRITGCNFLWIIPDFIPEDKASGGIRVILYKEI